MHTPITLAPHAHIYTTTEGHEWNALAQCFPAITPQHHFVVLTDEHTYAALGERLIQTWQSQCRITAHVFPSTVKPSLDLGVKIAVATNEGRTDGIIAVGSGTLNDLAKYAAHKAHLPYAVFATAPSMNGYLSANASMITPEGQRVSVPATLATKVICDMAVIHNAPKRLHQAGLGDALCRSTAQVDWLLSHRILGTPYDEGCFTPLLDTEAHLIAHANQLSENSDYTAKLVENLLLSGLSMTRAGGSYPASQAEHMLAHCVDVLKPEHNYYHGEAIAVTCRYIAAQHEDLLHGKNTPTPQPHAPATNKLRALFGDALTFAMVMDYDKKRSALTLALQHTPWDDARWHTIRSEALRHHISPDAISKAYRDAGLNLHHEALGIDNATWHAICEVAAFTRDRFTCLDMH